MPENTKSLSLHKGQPMTKSIPDGSVLKKLIRLFRSNSIMKHHFQVGGSRDPQGTAKAFFKNAYSYNQSVIPGYSGYDRFARYSDYAEMESHPILANALNIVADEVTQKNEDGKVISVISENKDTEKTLRELFTNILHLNGKQGWKLVRNLIKYGDAVYLIDITPENGVVGLIHMPANEVEREEGFDKDEPSAVRFRWTAKQNVELPNAYVAHFRLEGNDMFHPYGQCLRGCTFIQTKDGIKEIQNIKKGDKVVSFDIENQKQIISEVLDAVCSGEKECFKISTRHNFLEASSEHKVLICREKEFKYISVSELEINDKLIISKEANSENRHKINKEKPLKEEFGQKVDFAWRNIDCIPDFVTPEMSQLIGFLFGDGFYDKCPADRKHQKNDTVCFAMGVDQKLNEKYLNLMENFSGAPGNIRKVGNSERKSKTASVHSVMLAEILKRLEFKGNAHTKRVPKWVFSSPENIKRSFLEGFQDADGTSNIDRWECERFQIEICNEKLLRDIKALVQSLGWKSGKISKRVRKANSLVSKETTSYNLYYYKSKLKQNKKDDIENRKSNEFIVEPVISIENIGSHKVYDIHVDNKFHNFYANGVVVHNSILEPARRPWRQLVLLEDAMMVYRITRAPERRIFYLDVMGADPADVPQIINKFNETIKKSHVINEQGQLDLRYGGTLAMDEDYVIPVRGADSSTRIDTLPGGQNLGDIEDIEFIRANLFSALGIPKAFLTFDQDMKSKQVLTQEDIRFARTVARIQEVIIDELIKIAMIHLYVRGTRGEDLVNFKIKMTNPSTVAELQKMELLRARMELVMSAKEGVFDTNYIYKEFLNLSDDAIEKIRKGQIQDKMFQAKLLQIENAQGMMQPGMGGMGMDPGMGGMGAPMGGMGMDPGMGGGMPDMGGAPPNVSGVPAMAGEALEHEPEEEEEDLDEYKDLHRDSSGNFRTKARRGLDGTDLTMAGDPDDDPNDMEGIRRTYSSPMGGRESLSVSKRLVIESIAIIDEIYKKEKEEKKEDKVDFPLGISEKVLEQYFKDISKGNASDSSSGTKGMLVEAVQKRQKELYEAMGWEDELELQEEKINKLLKEVY